MKGWVSSPNEFVTSAQIKPSSLLKPITIHDHYLYASYASTITTAGALAFVLALSQLYHVFATITGKKETLAEPNLNILWALAFALFLCYQMISLLFVPIKRTSFDPVALIMTGFVGFLLSLTLMDIVDGVWIDFGLDSGK